MTKIGADYSNEMLSSYLDGSCTPLEQMIIKGCENQEDIQEILDITNGYKEVDTNLEFNDIDISDTIDNYLKPYEDYKELKTSLEKQSDLIK